jgi:AP-1 complex subunit mu
MMMLTYLWKAVDVLVSYFDELEEESIKDNFVVVYELLDEMMDFGYPQVTESDLLKDYIKIEGYKLEKILTEKNFSKVLNMLSNIGTQEAIKSLGFSFSNSEKDTTNEITVPKAVTNAISWRKEGIFHKKNEVFLDVIELISLQVSKKGQTINSEISGSLKMKTFLTGMPELKLGLNDKVLFEALNKSESAKRKAVDLDDVKFHHCVRMDKFKINRSITFVPPDGSFDLMNYRLSGKNLNKKKE